MKPTKEGRPWEPRHAASSTKSAGAATTCVSSPSPCARPSGARARARVRVQEARIRSIFNTVAVLLVALTALGLVRVAVLARAAEMTMTESSLTKEIKTQRIETDQLELDRTNLATPSRIEEIASATMSMSRPQSVRYITMPGVAAVAGATGTAAADPAADPATRTSSISGAERVAAILGTLAEMSAGEAQTLLVGDVGLAGSR